MTGSTIYNTTDGPLLIDRAGRVLGARDSLPGVDVEASPVAGHIADGRVVVVDDPSADAAPEAAPADQTKPRGTRRGATTTQEG